MIVAKNMLVGSSQRVITNACRFIILVVVAMIITMTPKIHVLNNVHLSSVRNKCVETAQKSRVIKQLILLFSQGYMSVTCGYWKLSNVCCQLVFRYKD